MVFSQRPDPETTKADNEDLSTIYNAEIPRRESADLNLPGNPLYAGAVSHDADLNQVNDDSVISRASRQPAESLRTAGSLLSAYAQDPAISTDTAKIFAGLPPSARVTEDTGKLPETAIAPKAVNASVIHRTEHPMTGQAVNNGKTQFTPQSLSLNLNQSTSSSASRLAAQTQLQVQSVVSELSNIESAASAAQPNHFVNLKASQWGPIPVNTSAALPQQAQQLAGALREQVRFQIDQQVKQAEIRLDPPELGKLEMNVKLDGDRLHVQLHAATAHARDALQAGIERLRGDLTSDHGGQVDVNISYGDQGSGPRHGDDVQIIAGAEAAQTEQTEQESVTSELDVRA